MVLFHLRGMLIVFTLNLLSIYVWMHHWHVTFAFDRQVDHYSVYCIALVFQGSKFS